MYGQVRAGGERWNQPGHAAVYKNDKRYLNLCPRLLPHENGKDVPQGNGAPVRLRVERHCGYRNLKFLKSIQVVASVEDIGLGKGGLLSDFNWHWYAGA